ncbi:N-6 DNA methylase [Acidovorax sp. Leaf73]|uniref:N-6 DNA methylase n=1 Tax=Acidovorax sp. Leaf73 TaxID=2876566 RepID=UPI001E4A3937|nr:N-6 DNA methylase [Acidovorax sp. Leaf73]
MLDAARTAAVDAVTQHAYSILRQGSLDLEGYRDVVIGILALKFLSDIQAPGWVQLGHGADAAVPSPLRHLELPTTVDFHALLENSEMPGIGDRLDAAFHALAAANRMHLDGIQGLRFSSTRLGETKERDRTLGRLMAVIGHDSALDFRQADASSFAAAAYACDTLLTTMAGTLGKRGVEFFTPPAISRLMAELLEPRDGESIMDPCCGTGGALIAGSQRARQNGDDAGCELYGQEINGETLALARLNMVLHNENRTYLAWGDVLQDPKFIAPNNKLRTFDVVLSSPPYNVAGWQREAGNVDPLGRFWRGIPPATSANYAFISHMVESMSMTHGRMAVVMPMGALFRGGAEAQIRRKLLEENLFDAVIALPAKLMPSTAIPVAILVLRRCKQDEKVLFIDGSNFFEYGKTQNTLGPTNLQRIVQTYRQRQQDTAYSRLVSLGDIADNEFNLNVGHYIQVQTQEEQVDLEALRAERLKLQAQLSELEMHLAVLRQDTAYG